MILALLVAGLVASAPLPRLVRRDPSRSPSSVADLARLLAIAAAAGLPLGTALDHVVGELHGPLRHEVEHVIRAARTTGLTAALLACPALESLGPALARAHGSGAPLVRTLQAHLAAHSSARVAEAMERARTAPVKVIVPLALLLLPGFTALVVGPTLLDHLVDVTGFGP